MRSNKIHTSLHEVRSAAGVELIPLVWNISICAIMFIGPPKIVLWPLITLIVHRLLQYLFRKDPKMCAILWRYRSEADRYDPWPQRVKKSARRPYGMGRDIPLA